MDLFNTIREWVDVSSTHPIILKFTLLVLLLNVVIALIILINTMIVFSKNKFHKRRILFLRNELPLFYYNVLKSDDSYSVEDIQFEFRDHFNNSLEIDFEWLIIELAELIKNYPSLKLSKNYETLLNYIIQSNAKLIEIYSHTKVNNKKFKKSIDVLISDLENGENKFDFKQLKPKYTKEDLFKAFNFDLNKELNEWDFLLFKNFYSNYDNKDLPYFASWVESTYQHSQKICFLKLIGAFKQMSSAYILEEQLNSSNEDLRRTTYETIGKLKYKNIEDKLFLNFPNETEECRKEILKSIFFISSGKATNFLKKAYHSSISEHEKKLILEILYKYDEEGKSFFEQEYSKVGFQKKNVFEYILNPIYQSELKKEVEYSKSLNIVS